MEVGADIVEIARVRALARRQPRFLTRVFSPEEIAYCRGKRLQWQHFAVRFAAKEAVWKSLGAKGLAFRDISVSRGRDGRPIVMLKGRATSRVKITLSHSERYALAVAVRTR
jgi:holo-[acyl-carrier protein] synthase